MPRRGWGEAGPPEDFGPKGDPEALGRAIDAAAALSPTDRSEALARAVEIETEFNRESAAAAGVPRLKQMRERLQRIEKLSRELASEIRGLDDYSLEAIARTSGIVPALPDRRFAAADPDDLQEWPLDDEPWTEQPWVNRLQALAALAGETEFALVAEDGADPDNPDKGGDANRYRSRWKHPKWRMAVGCWHLMEWMAPRQEITATTGGRFSAFLAAIYEYATGRDADGKGVGLEAYVKAAVRHCEMRRLEERLKDIDAMLENLRRFGTRGVAELELERQTVSSRLSELTSPMILAPPPPFHR